MNTKKSKRLKGVRFCAAMITLLCPALLPAQVLYWSQFESPQVGHANLDGSGRITVAQPNQVFGMETLDAARQVYWIDNGARTIMRANADFSDATVMVEGLADVGYNLNLALAPAANLIFWSSADAGTISWANLEEKGTTGHTNNCVFCAGNPRRRVRQLQPGFQRCSFPKCRWPANQSRANKAVRIWLPDQSLWTAVPDGPVQER